MGVLGASGYAGRELCAIIARHPGLELSFATANERRGERARLGGADVRFVAHDDAPLGQADLVFSALPHGASAAWVERVRAAGAHAVDLSSDLRPGNGSNGVPYGLTELTRDQLRDAPVVANPGCYPTAILMGLAPLARRGLIETGGIVTINASSGVTGAGFTPRPDLLFAEVAEDYKAYAVGNSHRHLAEMRSVLAGQGADADLIFTPHLLPVARGILATITVPLSAPLDEPLLPWQEDFGSEPFVEVDAEPPTLRDVVRRNVVRISARPVASVRRPMLVVISAIDNLVKGAAGQAVQNANVVLGLDEPMGLPA